ncbi:ABC transporter permease [Crossiella sp. SN42]|uniref:ABC transporter permease n=1 Tax=Crossiella sp. SN42 TaxID=2944808 RepID=UPI00207C6B5B|nr:ABC transporter permease [Crossiella sp. SN42]MCO1574607.1 ABC transporter permease [Crossiella sp. SN42]
MTSPSTRPAPHQPSTLAIGLRRGGVEIRQILRQKDTLIFTFTFPVIIMLTFGAVFNREIPGTGVDFRQYFMAGMIATGVMAAAFITLGVGIAIERDDGTLKRLRGTPMRASSYFIGKFVMVFALCLGQVVLLLGVATLFLGLSLPETGARWLTFAWVMALGVLACTVLGIAISAVPRSGRSAAGVVVLPFMVLQFVSGVFFVFTQMPAGVQQVGALFPLKWMGQGLRSAFLPDVLQRVEAAGSWDHGTTALVLGAWVVGGTLVSLLTFRWYRQAV